MPVGLEINNDGTTNTATTLVDEKGRVLGVPVLSAYPVCSGHGICKTMRQASKLFNGLTYTRPPVNYNNWDADRIMGCVCDYGYTGYDCSLKQCPKGIDPSVDTAPYSKYETHIIMCQANSGYFALQVLGQYSELIPYDADPQLLRMTLQSLLPYDYDPTEVLVIMPTNNNTNTPTVCRGDIPVFTRVILTQKPGPRPPIRVLQNVSDSTRRWYTHSVSALSLHGSSHIAKLAMASEYIVHCTACTTCTGNIYFSYLGELSDAVSITSASAANNIEYVLQKMFLLQRAGYSRLTVNVTILSAAGRTQQDKICNTGYNTTTLIYIYSDYGNIHPALRLVAAVSSTNVTMSDNTGNGTLIDCSAQGLCDYSTGLCRCIQSYKEDIYSYRYRAVSSNGYRSSTHHSVGYTGDCGYLLPTLTNCETSGVHGTTICSGHGVCENSTSISGYSSNSNNQVSACRCYDDYYGMDCSLRSCPKGIHFFDEAILNDTAHQVALECSGQGICDPLRGECNCRNGFAGPACDIKTCPATIVKETSSNTYYGTEKKVYCHGHGRCVSIRHFFQLHGLEYGNISYSYREPGLAFAANRKRSTSTASYNNRRIQRSLQATNAGNWDADIWFECLCSANDAITGSVSDPYFPTVGPNKLISGYASGSPPLPGYTHYDCSLKRCPVGDSYYPRYGYLSKKEVQRVTCTLPSHRNNRNLTLSSFSLRLFDLPSATSSSTSSSSYTGYPRHPASTLMIHANDSRAQIAAAISYLPTIGNVSIVFPDHLLLNISTACSVHYNSSFGGFLVIFDTESGANLPLLRVEQSHRFAGNISITRFQAGNGTNEECSGPRFGYCDRQAGKCHCFRGYSSSNGPNGPGNRGDCSYFSGKPLSGAHDPYKYIRFGMST
jgi:hypothetical protein